MSVGFALFEDRLEVGGNGLFGRQPLGRVPSRRFDRHPSPLQFRRHPGYAALIVSFSPRARTTPKSVLSLGSPSADRAL